MPIKSDITNASDALWSAPVERESVIGALAAAPRSAALKLRRRPANWNSGRAMFYRLVARYRSDPHTRC